MIKELFGNSYTHDALKSAQGKTIEILELRDNALVLMFTDGTGIRMFDDGQSCCEYRWMHTDDELGDFVGSVFLGAEIRDGPTELDTYREPKESQFLIITTSIGQFTMVNYNEHNGYYGGFWLVVRAVPPPADDDLPF